MIVKLNYKDSSFITMEQRYSGAKVKITIQNKGIGGTRGSLETIYVDKDSANKFYSKRVADGYKRV